MSIRFPLFPKGNNTRCFQVKRSPIQVLTHPDTFTFFWSSGELAITFSAFSMFWLRLLLFHEIYYLLNRQSVTFNQRLLATLILTLPSQYILDSLMYIKKNLGNYRVHSEVHSHETRGSNNLVPAYCRLKRCQTGSKYWGIKFFNCLPGDVRVLPEVAFKNKVKGILLQRAFYSFDEFLNCDFVR